MGNVLENGDGKLSIDEVMEHASMVKGRASQLLLKNLFANAKKSMP